VANEFTETPPGVHLSALFEIGLVLLGITLLVNALARLLLRASLTLAPAQ
jgi:ABC-type phosphate transport system permease subunit